jgi:hypothetical protein
VAVTNTVGSGTGSGPVAVNGGTLQGTGFIFPAAGNGVTVAAGGTLQPGSATAAGTLTVGTPTVLSSVALNGTFQWNISAAGTSSSTPGGSGGTVSKLAVNGNLTFTPTTFAVNSVNTGATGFDNTQAYSWVVASGTGTTTLGAQPTFTYTTDFTPAVNGSYSLSTTGGGIYLSYTPVPEPGIVLGGSAVLLGFVGLARRIRRRA